jgi:hypothetical protein
VGKNSNILEINGIRYDAKTGATILAHGHANHKSAAAPLKTAVKRPTMSDVVRHPAKPATARKQNPSSTLMRSAVKKPSVTHRKHSKAQGHVDMLANKPVSSLVPKKSVNRLDDKRLVKARRIPQSKLIQHFSLVTSDSNKFMAIAPAPLINPMPAAQPAPMPNKVPAKRPKTTAELLDHALRNATSHEQKPHPKTKQHRGLKITASALLLLVLAGVVISQQIPNMRMHLASAKAGFHASMPGYRPAGYSLGKLDTNGGVIATTFNSNSDNRKYTLTQKTSNWDSQALRDNFVVTHDKNYKILSSGGRTIFVYGNHDATWVNGGIWYIVQSDGALTNNQLVELASSL